MKTLLLAALLLPFGLFAQTPETPFFIEVFGEAKMEVRPDVLIYSVAYYNYTESEGGYGDFATDHVPVSVETAEKILLDLAKKYGVAAEKMSTDKYTVIPESPYSTGQFTYTLEFNDLPKLERFVEDLRKEKIFSGSFATMRYSKEKEANRELRAAALENARAKAEELAAALGKKLGPATQLWEESPYSQSEIQQMYYYGEGVETLPTPTFGGDPAKSTLRSKLRVRFAFY
jgi:uncharacterized protein YggE